MPSLINIYKSAPKNKKEGKETKGDILSGIQNILKMPYPTVRRKLLEETFSYAEKVLISMARKEKMESLFPEEK